MNYWASWAYGGDLHSLQQEWNKLRFKPSAVKELLNEHMLVVLDDVWDLDAIQPLLEALPSKTAVLVTTRDERIAKTLGEAMPLSVLSPEDALELLREFLPKLETEQLEKLAHGLGYHAQALAIAGGDIRVRSRKQKAIKDLLQRVEKGHGFGDLPQLDEQSRQSIVEITFRFSYDDIKAKMKGDYQQKLRLLGAFGPLEADFSSEAAAALWQDDVEDAIEFLDVLQARSLLVRRDGGRWGQHQLLRSYSKALLGRNNELEMASQRYINYAIDFADNGFQRPLEEWIDLKPDFPHLYYVGDKLFQQLSEKLGNLEDLSRPEPVDFTDELDESTKKLLKMAVQFSGNTAGYVVNRPEIGERGFNWLWMGLASARLTEEKPEKIVIFLLVLGSWYGSHGQPKIALNYFEQALPISQKNESKEEEAELLNQIGMIYQALSEQEKALKFYNKALPFLQKIENRDTEAAVLSNIGNSYQYLSQPEKALEFFNKALPILQEVGNRNGEATVLQNIGASYQYLSQPEKALEFFNKALPILQEVGNRNVEATVLQSIGVSYQYLSQSEKALEFFNEALPISQEIGNRNLEAAILQTIGTVYQALSQQEKALEFLNKALPIYQQIEDRDGEATVLQNIGVSYQYLSQQEKALEFLNKALPILREVGNRNGEATVLQNIGISYQHLSQQEKALEFYNKALPILREVGNRNMEATVLQNIGVVYQALSQQEKSAKLY